MSGSPYIVRATSEAFSGAAMGRVFVTRDEALRYAAALSGPWEVRVNGDLVRACEDCDAPVVECDGELPLFCNDCTREAREASAARVAP